MFALNEKVVYPGHGVARVRRVIERVVDGCVTHFYELRFINKDMTILVPVDNLSSIGIRALSSANNIENIFHVLEEPLISNPAADISTSNWNKRNKKYQLALRSGDIIEISKMYRDLHRQYITLQRTFFWRAKLTTKYRVLTCRRNINGKKCCIQ